MNLQRAPEPTDTAPWWPHVIVVVLVLVLTSVYTTVRDRPGALVAAPREHGVAPQAAPLPSGDRVDSVLADRAASSAVVQQALSLVADASPLPLVDDSPVPPAGATPPASGESEPPDAPSDPAQELLDELSPVLSELSATLSPALYDAAIAAGPVAAAIGPALRPTCATAGLAVIVATLGSGAVPAELPLNLSAQLGPVFVLCSMAFDAGPADDALATLDATLGPALTSEIVPALTVLGAQLQPLRDALAVALDQACPNLALASGVEASMPAPTDRVSLLRFLCSGVAEPSS